MAPSKQTLLTSDQKDMIFENMSDGIMTVNDEGDISYFNSTCAKIFNIKDEDEILGKSFEECFLNNKKNKAFNKLFKSSMQKHELTDKTAVKYKYNDKTSYLDIDISLVQPDNTTELTEEPFHGMVILIEDVTDRFALKQHEHDCAFIFAGLIICISLFLFTWTLLRFTLNIYLKSSSYTLMIEGITFALFLEIVFLTSFSMRDIGLIPKLSMFKKNLCETILTAAITCSILLLSKALLTLFGYQIKAYYIGGSRHGAYVYIYTAFVQEFLARGVIQTSVKSLMKVKYQKTFSIVLTSLLFSLMHMPFGFYFMFGAFMLSLALGYIYERQENIWGCVILHWCCGYLAMCLFF